MKARRAKRKSKPKLMEPGRQILPEDRATTGQRLSLAAVARTRGIRVVRTEREFVPQYHVENRLMRAMKTIRALPDKERGFLRVKGPSLPYVQEYIDAYAASEVRVPMFMPTPEDVSDCMTALSWVRHLDKRLWKIMWLRSFDFSFGLIGRYIGRSDETVRRWYREGITDAWSAANGI